MLWNPKEVVTPIAEEFEGKMCPVSTGGRGALGAWIPEGAREGLF